MKFLLVILVVLVGIWLWRTNRQTGQKQNQKPSKAAPQPLEMVRCQLCSVHVPLADAIRGKNGSYCSTDHLHRAEH